MCIACDDPNCQECTQANVCAKCISEEYTVSKMGSKCVKKIDNCYDPNPTGSGCRVCNDGFKLNNGKCVECAMQDCLNCDTAKKCSSCANGLVPNADHSACVKKLPNCVSQMTNDACDQCTDGYKPSDAKQCVICQVDNCDKCNTVNVCAACKNTYQLLEEGTVCKVVCEVPNCHQCDGYNHCASCNIKFGPNSKGECIPCTDPSCKFCSGDQPDQCTVEFTKEELEGKKVPWWAWLLVGIGAALLVGFIIFMVIWCCRDPVSLMTEYEENYDEYDKASRSGSSSRGSRASGSDGSSSGSGGSGRSSRSGTEDDYSDRE
ncbi:hypothetical protein, conserved [Angomonas deanei]|uniref:Uncharacterized protein n=1 Tax=Angomonas deanei TaxID=59799 RepID=A0A7G2C7B5_9TRYP|nr:hypothetical protein, conserved [Angomonas deanei]